MACCRKRSSPAASPPTAKAKPAAKAKETRQGGAAALQAGAEPGDRLRDFDFAAHNAEVAKLWPLHRAGQAPRVPVIWGINTRYCLLNPTINQPATSFLDYSEDPDVMFDTQLRVRRWLRFNLLQDTELGLPTTWQVNVDFQNYYEAVWFGCPLEYREDQVPDSAPAFADCPERVMEHGYPDPFGGLFGRGLRYYEHFKARCAKETFLGRPIQAGPPSVGTDGPMTVACNLFGPSFVCTAMLTEPERLAKLFEFIAEATIRRLSAWRKLLGIPVPQDGYGYADDSVALLSTRQYTEHVLPWHRRLCDALASPAPRSIHLCGDATRLFPTLQRELNIQSFDTGYPVDFAWLRRTLGEGVTILGGPRVALLCHGTPAEVREEGRRILQSGVLAGRRFTLREGNNLAPLTPLDNTEALYHAARQWGQFN